MNWDFTGANRPGPGVAPGTPRKKGAARFFEMLARDWPGLVGANLICFASFLPAALAVSFGLVFESFWITLLGGLLGGALAGPFWLALTDTTLRTLQDDPTGWWGRWRHTLKRCWRNALLLGGVEGAAVAGLLFVGSFFLTLAKSGAVPALAVWLVLLVDLLLLAVVFTALWPTLPLTDAPLPERLKLCGLLLLRCPARLVGAAAVRLGWWAALLALFPTSVLPAPLLGFWPVALVSAQILYPALETAFDIPRYEIPPTAPRPALLQNSEIWWRRHWGWVVAGVAALSGALGVFTVLAARTEPDLQIAVVTTEALPDEVAAALQAALTPYASDTNGDGKVSVAVNHYAVSFTGTAQDADVQMAGQTLLVTDLSAGDSTLWLLQDADGFMTLYGDKVDPARRAVWDDCPLLTALDAGRYTVATAEYTGERTGQQLLADFTLAPTPNGAALFNALTK